MISIDRERLLFISIIYLDMRIAVCVDGRAPSKKALAEAVDFAEMVEGDIILVHSAEKNVQNSDEELIREGDDNAINRGRILLDDLEKTVDNLSSTDLTVSKEIVSSENGKVNDILSYIDKNNINYVFIGHRGLNDRKERYVGSFAKDMISESNVPVTVVSS
jgi:nucleotide-binding universal stress UspA family protein